MLVCVDNTNDSADAIESIDLNKRLQPNLHIFSSYHYSTPLTSPFPTPSLSHYLTFDTSPPGAGVGASTSGIYFNSLGIFGRILRMTLAHPLLALSVKMVTLPELQTSNWFLSYLHTLAKQGVGGLYSGIRASFLFAALPMNHIWLGKKEEKENIP